MKIVSGVFSKILNRSPSTELIPNFAEQPTLPKLIHQVFFPAQALPAELEENLDNVRRLNPSWKHALYDDVDMERFIRSVYGDAVFELFERIDPVYGAARADLFRYLLLYKLGGVYLDIKSAATLPLDTVLRADDRYILSQWPHGADAKFQGAGFHGEIKHVSGGEYQQWYIVATPGHPFLKAVVENVLRNIVFYNPALHGVGKPAVLRVTGPIAYTLAIHPILARHPYRRVDAERDLGIQYSIYPSVDKGVHPHLRLFKNHYSQSRTSLIRLTGLKAALTAPVLAAEEMARQFLNALGRR